MAVHVPALSAKAAAKAAIQKTGHAQDKLREAQEELDEGHASLDAAIRTHSEKAIATAAHQNRAAEVKVQDAVEELDVVKQLLTCDAAPADGGSATVSRSGFGAKSVIPHLPKTSR